MTGLETAQNKVAEAAHDIYDTIDHMMEIDRLIDKAIAQAGAAKGARARHLQDELKGLKMQYENALHIAGQVRNGLCEIRDENE